MYIFCILNIKGMKMQGLNNNLIYKPYCNQKRQTKKDIKKQTPNPRCEVSQCKKMTKKKKCPKIQPKEGSLSIYMHLTVMKNIQEDSTTIKTYPTNTKLSNQAKKDDVHDCQGRNRVCTLPIEQHLTYVSVFPGKNHVCVLKHCHIKDNA